MFFSTKKNVFNINKDKKSNREQFQHQSRDYQKSDTDSQWQFEKRDQRIYFKNDEWNEKSVKKSYEFEKKKFYENNDEYYQKNWNLNQEKASEKSNDKYEAINMIEMKTATFMKVSA